MEKPTWKDGKPQANRTSVSICLFILLPKHPTALLKESHPALRGSQSVWGKTSPHRCLAFRVVIMTGWGYACKERVSKAPSGATECWVPRDARL